MSISQSEHGFLNNKQTGDYLSLSLKKTIKNINNVIENNCH